MRRWTDKTVGKERWGIKREGEREKKRGGGQGLRDSQRDYDRSQGRDTTQGETRTEGERMQRSKCSVHWPFYIKNGTGVVPIWQAVSRGEAEAVQHLPQYQVDPRGVIYAN